MEDLLDFYVNGKLISYIESFDLFTVRRFDTGEPLENFCLLKEAIEYCKNN